MNNGQNANRMSRAWIVAALCGLLAAAFMVSDAKANYEPDLFQEMLCDKIDPAFHDTVGCPWFGNPAMEELYDFFTKKGKKYPNFPVKSEQARELNWLWDNYEDEFNDKQWLKVIKGWIAMQKARAHSWVQFKGMLP